MRSEVVDRQKYVILPNKGKMIISTDLHGNYHDYKQLKDIFLQQHQNDNKIYWIILGDVVHGPNREFAEKSPLYNFEDLSWQIVEDLISLQTQYPNHIYYILGNHDHGHIGGPHTTKFYDDEVVALEKKLTSQQQLKMQNFFRKALLAVIAPCGLFLTHGSPDDTLKDIEHLNNISFDILQNSDYHNQILKSFLTHYGQESQTTNTLLRTISKQLQIDLHIVVHGHDRDVNGWFTEGKNQCCPVIFGAFPQKKRYMLVDLSKKYTSTTNFQVNQEIRTLYTKAVVDA